MRNFAGPMYLRSIATFILVVAASGGPVLAQRVDLIQAGDDWKYLKGKSAPPADWNALSFNDASWSSGRSGFGMGDGDDVTILDDMKGSYRTVYVRRAFTVDDPAAIRKFFLRINYQDGFVAYVNGTEAARMGLGAAGTPVSFDTSASAHDAGVLEVFDLAPALGVLVPGRNILAVEIHNDSLTNGSVSLVPVLRAYLQGPALVRGPYLQLVTESSILVVWETDPPGLGSVEYGATAGLGSRVDAPLAAALHEVELKGLASGTGYFYRVLADGAPLSPVSSFRTAPTKDQGRFRLAVYGDTEKLTEGLLDVPGIVASMQPALSLSCGDQIRDGDSQTYFFDAWARVLPGCPVFPAVGNHDAETSSISSYLQAFYLPTDSSKTERYYSFNYGNAHFVCLDVEGSYGASSNQYKWFRADLGANDRPWSIVFLHESPYSTGTVHGSNTTVRSTLGPVFDEFKVDLVFTGHNHNYERTFPLRGGTVVDRSAVPVYADPQGTIYIVTGGAGGTLYAQSGSGDKSFSALFKLVNHALQVDIDGGLLLLKAIDRSGTVIDTLEIRKTIGGPKIGGLRATDLRGTSARIVWTTDVPADSAVEYSRDGSFGLSVLDDSLVTEHGLDLPGLDPDTEYQARVLSTDGSGSTAAGGPVAFRTMRFFVRGDANGDGAIDVSDPIRILLILFQGVQSEPCPDAADVDDSGALDVTDAILLLEYLFRSMDAPTMPFPDPGDDPLPPDLLTCRAG